MTMASPLVVAMTGASGAYAAQSLIERSPWKTWLIASDWARQIYAHECGPFDKMETLSDKLYANDDMTAPPASGSVPTAGMVILPCSVNTLGQIAAGLGNTLIARAAHCHLKERRPLVIGLRETPLTAIDLQNAAKAVAAGATVMPLCPPFYMLKDRNPDHVTLRELVAAYVDRILALLGHPPESTWEDVR
jgi:4-hydroxy-3-polyprenylbenzoate decarboxylase